MPHNVVKKNMIWSLRQKRKLIALLRQYPLDDYESIARRFSDKDEDQVREFIESIKYRIQKNKKPTSKRESFQKPPLDEWLEVASDMVAFENVDCSENLAKVMSIISQFEDFKTIKLEGREDPDFHSIYRFLAQILQPDRKEDIEQLGALESAVMLDMIYSLMDVLSSHDTTVQRNIMQWKYLLMEYRTQGGLIVNENLRRASENDFTEFIDDIRAQREKEKNREMVYMARRIDQMSKEDEEKQKNEEKPSTSITTTSSTSTEPASSNKVQLALFGDSSDNRSVDKPVIKKHKPGRKGALDPPETPRTEIVLVMPPKGVEIVKYNPRAKKPVRDRLDGKYQSLNTEEDLISKDLNRDVMYDVHRTETDQFKRTKDRPDISQINKKRSHAQNEKELDQKYDSVRKGNNKKGPVKKPKLYSLNPFCLPVNLLDLDA